MPEKTPSHVNNPSAELCERLKLAVQSAATKNVQSMEALRAAVAEFTVALREQGTTPEAVLVSLKSTIHDRSLPLSLQYPVEWKNVSLRETISTWCIQEFFRDATVKTAQSHP